MTPARLLGTVAVVFALVTIANAQQATSYTARVIVDRAEVRSKPTDSQDAYPTNELHKGDIVEVVETPPGHYFGIKPPQGSHSWINKHFVKQINKQQWAVESVGGAPVLIGSSIKQEKPTVEGVKLERGAQVTVVGPEYTASAADGGFIWLPIVPPANEIRYVREQDVAKITTPVQATSGIPHAGVAGYQPLAGQPANVDPLYLQAQEAERAGRIDDAIRLYCEYGRKMSSTNDEVAHQCFNRANWLRQGGRDNFTAGRLVPNPGYASGQPVNCWGSSPICPAPGYAQSTSTRQTQSGYMPSNVAAVCTVQRGWLRATARKDVPAGTCALVQNTGELITYVTAPPTVDLQRYKGMSVEVSGQWVYDMGLRSNYMTVDQVKPLQ